MHRHPRSALILVLLALVASALVSPAPAAQAAGGGGLLESWGFPARLLDTRTGSRYGRLGPNETIVVRAGAPDGLCAVNVTAVNPTAAGYLSVVATSDIALQDKVSTLNFTPGVTVANATTVRVVDGSIAVHNGSGGTVDVIVDGLAHYTAGDPTDPGALALVTPQRLIDVRLGGNAALDVAIPGGAGAASAALLNITVDAPSGAGYVKAWPSQGLEPTVSNVNFRPGQTVANAAIVKVGADGKIKLRNGSPAPLRLIVDLGGTVVAGLPTAAGAFLPIVPERLVDSRIGQQLAAPLHAGADAYLEIAGHGAVPSDARAVALNMTAVTPEGAGYLAVAGGDPYVGLMASNANYVAGQDVAALVTADLVDRLVRVHSYAGAELVADAVGITSVEAGISRAPRRGPVRGRTTSCPASSWAWCRPTRPSTVPTSWCASRCTTGPRRR